MPKSKRPWNEDDVAKLKAMAGKEPESGSPQCSAEPVERQRYKPRSEGLSLRIKRPSKTKTDEDGAPAEALFNVLGIE